MRRSTRPARRAFAPSLAPTLACIVALAVACGLAAAQGGPVAPSSFTPSALVGDWAIQFPNQGGPPTIGAVTYRSDGSYEETLLIGGETAGWWRGNYQLAPDGTLVLNEVATSPQLCFAGQCQPNDPPTRTVAQLVTIDPSSYTATFVDETGMPATLTFQRVAGGAGPTAGGQIGGQVGMPGATPGAVPGAMPGSPPPAMPGGATGPAPATPAGTPPTTTVPASPLAPAPAQPGPDPAGTAPGSDPWLGTWSDGQVTVRIGGPDGAVLEVGGSAYPMSLSGDDVRLTGYFESGGQRYDITLQRTPDGMTVASGGSTYALRRAGGAPGSGNPLGGP